MNRNIIKFCTAALAGSILGIAYEKSTLPNQWSSLFQAVTASSSVINRDGNTNLVNPKWEIVDPVLSAENLKHSAKFGLPSKDNIRIFNDYLLSYDRRLRAPVWVIEHLTPEKLEHKNLTSRDNSKFHEDSAIHPYFRATHQDFKGSGYDRGHMAAAGNHKNGQDDLDQTFAYSNISPQEPEFNRGAWERLETYVRWRAKRAKNLYVVTGPLFLPLRARDGNLYVTYKVIGNNHISVPTHYFKVFLIEEKDDRLVLEAFVMPNDNKLDKYTKLNDYRVPINRLDTIERATGVIFFDQLVRDKVEAPLALSEGFKEDYVRKDKKDSSN